MNKTLKMLALALTMCVAMCGTAMAAPKGGSHHTGKAPVVAKAPSGARHVDKAPAHVHTPKAKPRHEVVHHHLPPARPAMHHEPKHHHHYHNNTLHTEDWCEIGASLLGGLIGGLIGAAI